MSVIPVSASFGSNTPKAEQDLYYRATASDYFRGDNCHLFHSMVMSEAGHKLRGEADFVYLDEEFLFFLEVKGGVVYFRGDTKEWGVMGGTKVQDPFRQASDNLFFVRDRLLPARFGRDMPRKLIYGYGVMFPESELPRDFSPYEKQSITYDARILYTSTDQDNADGLAAYIERLKTYWRNHPRYSRHQGRLTPEERQAVRTYFSRDLMFTPPLAGLLRRDAEQTTLYTRAQKWVIMATEAYGNRAGAVVTGGAGTGKTVVALWLAAACVNRGEKTLLLCFNKNLAAWLRSVAEKENLTEKNGLTIRHIHGLYAEYVRPRATAPDYFHDAYPREFGQHYAGLSETGYDRIIVDEAQDLFLPAHISNLDLLLKGGLKSNRWYVFLDKENQNIFKHFDEVCYREFCRLYAPAVLHLDKNCRNTTKVIRSTGLYTGISSSSSAKTTAGFVEEHYYDSTPDMISQLTSRLRSLQEEKVAPGDVVVLVPSRELAEDLVHANPNVFEMLSPHNVATAGNKRVRVSTPGGFKGLESPIIILAGMDSFSEADDHRKTLMYLSSTRATYAFIVYFHSALRTQVTELKQKNFLNSPDL